MFRCMITADVSLRKLEITCISMCYDHGYQCTDVPWPQLHGISDPCAGYLGILRVWEQGARFLALKKGGL